MGGPVWSDPAVVAFAGCPIEPVGLDQLIEDLERRWARGERAVRVGHHNLNSLRLVQRDTTVRRFYAGCATCYVDGLPVIGLMRLAGLPTAGARRWTLMHALPDLLDWLEGSGRSLFYLGGSPAAVDRGQAWIARGWPRLRCRMQHGYFCDDRPVVEAINGFAPDVLLVGMGMPRQEAWMLGQHRRLKVGAMLQAGGTLDYYVGLQRRPPRALSRLGLGWLVRLLSDPRRLWRRYLLEPWGLLKPFRRLRGTLRAGRS